MVSESESGAELLRRLAARRVEATSLRSVAGELGMSPSGLSKVLGGSRSQPWTRRRLERWMAWEHARAAQDGSDSLAVPSEFSVRVLVHGLPDEPQRRALRRMAEAITESYARAGVPLPPWVATLGAEADPGDAPSE